MYNRQNCVLCCHWRSSLAQISYDVDMNVCIFVIEDLPRPQIYSLFLWCRFCNEKGWFSTDASISQTPSSTSFPPISFSCESFIRTFFYDRLRKSTDIVVRFDSNVSVNRRKFWIQGSPLPMALSEMASIIRPFFLRSTKKVCRYCHTVW